MPRHGLGERALATRNTPAGRDHDQLAGQPGELAVEPEIIGKADVVRGELLGAPLLPCAPHCLHQPRNFGGGHAISRLREEDVPVFADEDAATRELARRVALSGR
jgi:hypothetical protein